MWLEVSPELSIVAKKVTAVQEIDQLHSAVYVDGQTFTVAMPKSVVMSMLESRVRGASSESNVERLLSQIYQGQVTARP